MANKRTRRFFVRSYISPLQINYLVLNHDIERYAYIYHDKDIDENGNLKVNHVHLVFTTYNAHDLSAVKRWFNFFDDNGKPINSDVQICADLANSFEYLTHKNDPDKFKYDFKLINSNDINYFESLVKGDETVSDDPTESIFFEYLEIVRSCGSIRPLLQKYGKNFLYHYNNYKSLALDIIYNYKDFFKEEEI